MNELHRQALTDARADDRRWFTEHPAEDNRVRAPFDHEICSVTGCGTVPIHFGVLVRRYGDLLIRKPVRMRQHRTGRNAASA